jgi:hypothetical protein
MPDTKSSHAEFPQQGSQKAGLGFPICRLLAVRCLHTGTLLAIYKDTQSNKVPNCGQINKHKVA